ncbi:hypothetical protein [Pseudomonas serbica]|jgi:hypothetical protein|uniref:hypothetical protein n=1 Tax=Pseudomonas serbica TaxID=2965074 RepID=UPI00237A6D66|nr:hypothetical protein [Pseudomonas serbica]
MMNSFNKTLLAGIVAATFCAPAFSDDTTAPATSPVAAVAAAPAAPGATAPQVSAATPAAPVAVVKKQDMTSKLPADLIEELKSSGDHNKEIDDLVRLKALAQAQSDLARAELDRDKARIELKRLTDPVAAATADVAAGVALSPPPAQAAPTASTAPGKSDSEESKVEETSILDDIYVTRIYMFGDKKSATVYIKNSVTTAELGEEVAAGVKMIQVTDKAATFQYKGKKRTVRLSTQEQAYGRSYDVSGKSNQTQQGMMQPSRSQLMPNVMPSGMSMGGMGGMGGSNGPAAMPKGMSMPTLPVPPAGMPNKMNAPPGF